MRIGRYERFTHLGLCRFLPPSQLLWRNNYVDEQTQARSDRMLFTKNGRKVDLVGTFANQSRWSSYAAAVTEVAVLLQALGMRLPCPPA